MEALAVAGGRVEILEPAVGADHRLHLGEARSPTATREAETAKAHRG